MKTSRIVLLIALFIAAIGPWGQSVADQRVDATYTSETTGSVISIGSSSNANFDPDNITISETGNYTQEIVTIASEFADLRISFLDRPTSLDLVMADAHAFNSPYGHKYEILLQQVDAKTATLLEFTTYKLQFIEVGYLEMSQPVAGGPAVVLSIYTTEEFLIEQLNWFAANVTIDGESPFLEQTYEHLQPLLDGTSDTTPQLMTDYGTALADWEELGLVSESEWRSPNLGSVVTWDSTWEVPFNRTDIIETIEGGLDSIMLITPDMDGEIVISIGSTAENADTPQGWINRWTSEEFTGNLAGSYPLTLLAVTSSENTAAVMYEKTSQWGHTYVVSYEAYLTDEGTVIATRTTATREDFGGIYNLSRTSVTVDGGAYPRAWTADEIEAVFAD